jgi:3-methylcrotonyl-CoA carboxylase alpha subunit
MFNAILIANRGEIACRIIATCRRLGIRPVVVYSDADAGSMAVRLADAAIRIGPPPARESYLCIDHILDAARQAGAQAIHPGYGFLAENAEFAEACVEAGIVFIGPPPAAIRAMGSKAAAKNLMREAGVPLTPGYDGSNQDAKFLARQADAIGYPVMIKANAGGGGKGMRRVDARDQFAAALASCKREAAAAFGNDSVLLEKFLVQPRHVEVQVFGDTRGNVISIFERDCSVQRRNQKVIEEAPAPDLPDVLRRALAEAGRNAARAVGYVGAGTVEFLVDRDGGFHFMEMNTRLQVEHPVTEMITSLDLVEWQLRVADGEPLPLNQDQLTSRGHAIEARIYAEDPAHDFLPSIGTLVHLKSPEPSAHLRIDTGVEQGDTITPFYDPMIAKLIVWDETRELAVRRMEQALSEYEIVGVANNTGFLRRLVTSPSFSNANLDTSLIEREHAWIAGERSVPSAVVFAIAALAVLLRESETSARVDAANSPWSRTDGWRLNAAYTRPLVFTHDDQQENVLVEYAGRGLQIGVSDAKFVVANARLENGRLQASFNDELVAATVVSHAGKQHIFYDGQHWVVTHEDPLDVHAGHMAKESSLRAPMPGRVIALMVQPGEHVEKGAPLMVLEAMKMECTIHAPADGSVESFHFGVGDQLTEGVELLEFNAAEENGA